MQINVGIPDGLWWVLTFSNIFHLLCYVHFINNNPHIDKAFHLFKSKIYLFLLCVFLSFPVQKIIHLYFDKRSCHKKFYSLTYEDFWITGIVKNCLRRFIKYLKFPLLNNKSVQCKWEKKLFAIDLMMFQVFEMKAYNW